MRGGRAAMTLLAGGPSRLKVFKHGGIQISSLIGPSFGLIEWFDFTLGLLPAFSGSFYLHFPAPSEAVSM